MAEDDFKDTEIGRIPREWGVAALFDLAEYINGYPFKPSDWQSFGIPIIRIQNLTESSHLINYYNGELSSRYLIENGNLLLAWSASLGAHIWKGEKAYLNQHIFKVIPRKDVYKDYLYYRLLLTIESLKKQTHGSTMKHFVKSALKFVYISLPTLHEQTRIAYALSTIQNAIEIQDKILEALQNLKKSMMHKLFTEGIGHTEFKDTEIGRIPKDWGIKKIKDVSTYITDGTHKTPHYIEYSQFGIPFISTENIKPYSSEYDFSRYRRYIDEISYKDLSKRAKAEKGDLLISKCGTIGRTQLIRNNLKIGIFVGLLLIKINNNIINGEYLENLLNSDKFRKIMESKSTGSTRKTLAINIFKNITIPIPPLDEQKRIADILSTIDKKISIEENRKESFENLFKTMLNKLMTCQIRVKDLVMPA